VARYPIGQPVRISTTVRDVTGALVDAGTLTLVVKIAAVDGTQTTTGTYASPAHDGLGLYHQDIPVTDLVNIGHYQYVWTSTGTGAGATPPAEFDIYDPFETAVLPLQDAKDQLNIPQSVTTSDAELQSWIATIESSLKAMTGGPIVNKTITAERAEMMDNQTVIVVRQRPLVSVTSITGAGGAAIDISAGLDLDVNAGTIRRRLGLPFYGPFFTWLPQVNVTYVAGWGTSVPAAFNSAARIILAHWWDTQHGPSVRPSMGGMDMVQPPGFGFAIPNRAAELLNGHLNGMPFQLEAYV
jgi:hypothetical protein